ncbi:MAG TPA: DUF6671 family protein [Kineosporiaceae bacterium]|nr:DUF6671 family protein [Kineosporiaceae bacterium]
MTGSYRGAVVAYGTRHGKERQAAGPFAEVLGARVVAPPDLDTDRFGTFSGEVPRTLAPLDAARAKARLALDATGAEFALASEASYGPLGALGLPGHEELLLFVDARRGFEVVERSVTLGSPGEVRRVRDAAELEPPAPGEAYVVRPDGRPGPIVKGVAGMGELSAAVAAAAALSASGVAVVEPDLRAMHNPPRQAVLADLSRRLAERLARLCPACAGPGWGVDAVEPGLPCAVCALPTDEPGVEHWSCPGCSCAERRPRPGTADPHWCPGCNP